ncbi:hypothetical protein SPLC1_S207190 [Arthrospira platensis C1]|nr:hypothetical protein SPLC1_S207190 [Arthrospira platensis C1]
MKLRFALHSKTLIQDLITNPGQNLSKKNPKLLLARVLSDRLFKMM